MLPNFWIFQLSKIVTSKQIISLIISQLKKNNILNNKQINMYQIIIIDSKASKETENSMVLQ